MNAKAHGGSGASGLLRELNTSLVTLTKDVTPAVVQIMVTSYGPIEPSSNTGDVALFARQHAIGSGVILDPNGYIITNAHVVEAAQRIRVTLSPAAANSQFDVAAAGEHRILEAKLVGADKDTDLALLKVDAHKLPVLGLAASRPVYPGEIVLAVGSPEGLQSSVTMGVVSSVERQPNPNEPAVYIQTDAPINPGNSGGPLVDIDGDVIGLNTMILSESGGSEGLGFAIPARTVRFVYENLRKYGHVHRLEIQAGAQEITPTLAQGLSLSQDWGVIISDVSPEGPAAAAGLETGDVVYSVDGRRIAGLPGFAAALYLHAPDQALPLDVLRGSQKLSLVVPAAQHHDKADDLKDFIDPQNLVSPLGVFVHDLDDDLRNAFPHIRIASGVIVVAQSPDLNSYTSSLRAGDILHAVNQTSIESVDQLRSMFRAIKSGQSMVLQIERAGKLQYVSFEWGD
ncbi:MAG: peptidase and chymotrypsin/Hap [Edaphobacter sp.]|nr:peptidase and chymotrypsin/Hap [Edaphobacter sp.]